MSANCWGKSQHSWSWLLRLIQAKLLIYLKRAHTHISLPFLFFKPLPLQQQHWGGKSGSNDVQTLLPVWPVSKHASPLTEPRPCSLIPAQTEVKAAHVRGGSQRFNSPAQWVKVTLTQAVSKQRRQEVMRLSRWDPLYLKKWTIIYHFTMYLFRWCTTAMLFVGKTTYCVSSVFKRIKMSSKTINSSLIAI